jgi:membrane peptidoglycan carboxypeptidase
MSQKLKNHKNDDFDEELKKSKYKPYQIDEEDNNFEIESGNEDLDLNNLSQAEIQELLNRYNQDFEDREDSNMDDSDFELTSEKSYQDDSEYEDDNDSDYNTYQNQARSNLKNNTPSYKKSTNFGEKIKFLPHNFKTFLVKHKKPIRFLFMLGFFIGLVLFVGAGIWAFGVYNSIQNGIVDRATRISEGSIVYDKSGIEMFRYSGDVKREVVDLNKIPKEMQLAIIALEDENFYDNEAGIPWQNIAGSAVRCGLTRGKNCRGGSGLSQQLIKNVTDDDERTTQRKLRELFTAIKFNQELPGTSQQKQDKVLELYLNWVPFGRNNYGVQTASRSYFGHNINSPEITIPKACYLASMPQIPSGYAEGIRLEIINRERTQTGQEPLPNPNFERLQERKNFCIQKLYELELDNRGQTRLVKTQQEADELMKEVVDFKKIATSSTITYGHLRGFISNEIDRKFKTGNSDNSISAKDLETRGFRIYTTFDKKLQDDIEKMLKDADEVEAGGGNNAAGVIMHGATGEIRAMVGSRDFNNQDIGGQVNVLTAPRQPGSSFKPYVYASAFNNGFNPGTVLLDVSTDFGGGYRPQNFSRTFSGVTTIRRSLQDSLNIPAVKAAYLSQAESTTPNTASATTNMLDFTARTGVKMPFRETCTLSAALGGCEVEHLSHTVGINTLLHEGIKVEPRTISRIDLRDKEFFSQDQVAQRYTKEQAIDGNVARQLANVMSDYQSRSSSVWGSLKSNLELEGWSGENAVAAKTGTTNDVKDMWAVGGTPEYTVTLWIGNTDGKPMDSSVSAARIAAPLWNRMMARSHQGITPKGFSKAGLQSFAINPTTGLPGQGRNELLTSDQITRIQAARTRLNDTNYNPLQNSIFKNMTPITSRTLKVNKLDNKLVTSSEGDENAEVTLAFDFPEELIEEIECTSGVSEFPINPAWLSPAQALGIGDEEEGGCPTEVTQIKLEDIQPRITTNLIEDDLAPEIITVLALSGVDNSLIEQPNQIKKIEVRIDGQIVEQIENQPSLEIIKADKNLEGIKNVEVTVIDRFGFTSKITINGVDFTEPEPEETLPVDPPQDGSGEIPIDGGQDPTNPGDGTGGVGDGNTGTGNTQSLSIIFSKPIKKELF